MAKTLNDCWNLHHDCEVGIFYKRFRNGDTVPGLYCQRHGRHIQWLCWETADQLVLKGVELLQAPPKKSRQNRNAVAI